MSGPRISPSGDGVPGIGRRDLLLSISTAAAAGLVLWQAWWWAGYPLGTFKPGLDGHGPDPYAWPRLLALWVPAAHVLFALAYAVLARWDPGRPLRRHFLADQASLALVVLLLAGLLLLGGQGHWRPMIGAWYTLFIGAKAAIFVRGLWRWLSSREVPASRASVGLFLGAFLPYFLLSAYVTTAISSTSDEPYYLLVTHSLLYDRDADLADNLARRDYLPFYWGELPTNSRAIRPTPDGRMYARLYQGFQPLLLLPGYAVAGREGAVATMNLLAAAALVFTFQLARTSGASLRAALLAWLGAAFSLPCVTYAASPFPEVPGAFFATAAAYLLWPSHASRSARFTASLSLAAMVAAKSRLFLLVPSLALGFSRRARWTSVTLTGGALAAAAALATAYDRLFLSGHIVWQSGGVAEALRWFLRWTMRAPLEYRGHLGLLLDQEFGLLTAAPVFALAIGGVAVAVAERRWRLLVLTAGPFACTWYYLGAAALGGVSTRGLSQWYGGFSPPARFLMAALPLFVVLAAHLLDRVRGRTAWSVTAALYAATLAYTATLSAWPAWRFQDGRGRAVALLSFFRRTGLDVGRFLPSFITPGAGWEPVGLVLLVSTLLAGYALSRAPGRRAPRGAWITGAVAAPLCVVVLGALAWALPSGAYPAVLGAGRGGAIFWGPLAVASEGETATRERLVWAAQRNGVLELAPRLPPGRYGIVVRVGAQATDSGPSLTIAAGTDPPQRVGLDSAAPPVWREREYATEVRWSGGRLPVRLELGPISRQDPVRLAYVDTVEIRRLSP